MRNKRRNVTQAAFYGFDLSKDFFVVSLRVESHADESTDRKNSTERS